jgi:histidine triad (HIT) family protein
MTDCIFCKIVSGELPAKIISQNEKLIAFDDIYPRAPHHKLIIPRKHIATLNDFLPEDDGLIDEMVQMARKLAIDLKIDKSGYRVLINCNPDSGQVVYHLHLHLLGGRPLPIF